MANPREEDLQGIYIALLLFATLIIALRFYARSMRNLQWSKPDIAIIVAWLLGLGVCVSSVLGAGSSWGKRMRELTPAMLTHGLLTMWIFEILYNPAMAAVRVSILLFYVQINPERRFRMVVYTTMALCVSFSVTAMFVLLFQCNPPAYFWSRQGEGKCLNAYLVFLVNAIVNLATDLWVLFLPIPMVWRLRIAAKQKFALSAVFAVGLVTCAAACVRFYYIRFIDTEDPMYDAVPAGIWSFVEIVTGITCASLPALRSLFTFSGQEWTGRSKSKPSYHSWSHQSGHRRLPGNGGLDGTSDRDLVTHVDLADRDRSVDARSAVSKPVALRTVGRGDGSDVAMQRVPTPKSTPKPESAAEEDGPTIRSKDIEDGLSIHGIKVDTSISVYNSTPL